MRRLRNILRVFPLIAATVGAAACSSAPTTGAERSEEPVQSGSTALSVAVPYRVRLESVDVERPRGPSDYDFAALSVRVNDADPSMQSCGVGNAYPGHSTRLDVCDDNNFPGVQYKGQLLSRTFAAGPDDKVHVALALDNIDSRDQSSHAGDAAWRWVATGGDVAQGAGAVVGVANQAVGAAIAAVGSAASSLADLFGASSDPVSCAGTLEFANSDTMLLPFTGSDLAQMTKDGRAELSFTFDGASNGMTTPKACGMQPKTTVHLSIERNLPAGAARGDFNRDGQQDVLWYDDATGEVQVWLMNGTAVYSRATVDARDGGGTRAGAPWAIVATDDFSGDGKPDILWHNHATGMTLAWFMDGTSIVQRVALDALDGGASLITAPWRIAGTNDFNGDGRPDILWHDELTGASQVWLMAGTSISARWNVDARDGGASLIMAPWWIVGTGDFNADGQADILWHNEGTGETQAWLMNGASIVGRATITAEDGTVPRVTAPWRIHGTNDYNADGQPDILWHNDATGVTQVWTLNRAGISARANLTSADGGPTLVTRPWRIACALPEAVRADFNLDGQPEIAWHNDARGETQIWTMGGTSIYGRSTVSADDGGSAIVTAPWNIVAIDDFNLDHQPDILWHNDKTGETQAWSMSGTAVASRATVRAPDGSAVLVGAPWSIVGMGDFNLDETPDVVWHNESTGETQIWLMVGSSVVSRPTVSAADGNAAFVTAPWHVVAVNDFNRDLRPDILWRNDSTGESQVWLMAGSSVAARATVNARDGGASMVGAPWRVMGANDFNRDLQPDIVWHNDTTGETQVWLMDGTSIAGRATVNALDNGASLIGAPWTIVGR